MALLVTLALAAPVAAQEAPDLTPLDGSQLLESRWLPWLGCWELVADAVDQRAVEATGRRVVCVAPRLDGRGVNLTTRVDSSVIADNTVIADGTERALPEPDCSGHQEASWSADGRRLHSAVEAACGDSGSRSVAGLNMLVESGHWIEIQSVSIDDRDHRELVVRQYARLDDDATAELGVATLAPALAARAAAARASAAAPLEVDDVIEAAATFPVEVLEAAILESGSMFALDTDALLQLADAGIDEGVIDLMVAVSFPDQFVVDSGTSAGGGGGGYASYPSRFGYIGYYGYPVNCWGRYYSPFYGPYGPGCGNYGYSPYGYSGYRPPYYGGGGVRVRPSVPPVGSLYGGRVIKGRGYTNPSAATPGNGSGSGTLSISNRSSASSGLGYVVRRAVRSAGEGGLAGRSGPRRGIGSVSPKGFSKPSSGGDASSGGGSSSGGAKPRTAKPRGGGGGGS